MVLTSSKYTWLVTWKRVILSVETYSEIDVVICESKWSTQIIDQAKMIIYKLTIEL